MKVQMIRTRSIQAVGANGPFTRVFTIGEVHDLPEMHAQMFIAQNDAVVASDKPAKAAAAPQPVAEAVKDVEVKQVKPAAKKAR